MFLIRKIQLLFKDKTKKNTLYSHFRLRTGLIPIFTGSTEVCQNCPQKFCNFLPEKHLDKEYQETPVEQHSQNSQKCSSAHFFQVYQDQTPRELTRCHGSMAPHQTHTEIMISTNMYLHLFAVWPSDLKVIKTQETAGDFHFT